MFGDNLSLQNKCNDCGLDFDNAHELQNHKRRFCINSGYDNLVGLAQIEWKGPTPTQRPKFSQKNHLQQYGSNSLTNASQYQQLTSSRLDKDMHNINKFKRQLEGVYKYKHDQPSESQASNAKSKINQSKLSHNSYSESRLDEQLKRYEKPLQEKAISPPTFIDHLNMKNHTLLDKSASTIARMPNKDKMQYARVKLDELNEIRSLYVENGGNRPEFKANVDKMIVFYSKLLKEEQEKLKQEGKNYINESQMIESRCSTPILKLRDFQEDPNKPQQSLSTVKKGANSKVNVPNQNLSKLQPMTPNYPQLNGNYPYPPPVIMMPYPQQPPSQSNDSLRFLEKMFELKSQQSKKLLQILLEDRKKTPSSVVNNIPENTSQMQISNASSKPTFKKQTKKGFIDETEDYQFKKSMAEDLISEEKMLLALQQQELDQLKLLSQLPKELQEIKMNSIIKSSETRFKMEKELLKQKMTRLAYQEDNQTFEEQRKLTNDRWAGEERKKLLEHQVDRYLDNFQGQFLPKETENEQNDED